MPVFAWEGRTRAGETRRGVMEGSDEAFVLSRLRAEGVTPNKVTQQAKRAAWNLDIQFGTGVTEQDLVIFTCQFATMIDAGLPLVQCLDILSTQTDNKRFGKVLTDVKNHVEGGGTFSEALRRHPKIFDELYCNLVQAGEIGGILDTILNRLGTYIEKNVKLKRQLKGAMVYPASVLVIAAGVIAILLWKVIPVFEKMFRDFRAGALPAPTRIVVKISNGFLGAAPFIFGGAIAFGAIFMWAIRQPRGKYVWHSFLLKLPIMGPVLRKIVVARFTRTLGTLLSSGVPILDSMEITAKTAGNVVVQKALMAVRERISQGDSVAGPLMETKVFPPMVVQMIGVGEQTGAMDTMLSKIADFYEDEVDVAIAAMTSLIEPIMIVFLGGVVGGMIVAMYLPIFEIAGAINEH